MKFIIALCLAFSLFGCAGSLTPDTAAPTAAQVSAKSLITISEVLKAVPATSESLYAAGSITKEKYNQVAVVYNKAIGYYQAAATAEIEALRLGLVPAGYPAYASAFNALVTLVAQIQGMLGGKP